MTDNKKRSENTTVNIPLQSTSQNQDVSQNIDENNNTENSNSRRSSLKQRWNELLTNFKELQEEFRKSKKIKDKIKIYFKLIETEIEFLGSIPIVGWFLTINFFQIIFSIRKIPILYYLNLIIKTAKNQANQLTAQIQSSIIIVLYSILSADEIIPGTDTTPIFIIFYFLSFLLPIAFLWYRKVNEINTFKNNPNEDNKNKYETFHKSFLDLIGIVRWIYFIIIITGSILIVFHEDEVKTGAYLLVAGIVEDRFLEKFKDSLEESWKEVEKEFEKRSIELTPTNTAAYLSNLIRETKEKLSNLELKEDVDRIIEIKNNYHNQRLFYDLLKEENINFIRRRTHSRISRISKKLANIGLIKAREINDIMNKQDEIFNIRDGTYYPVHLHEIPFNENYVNINMDPENIPLLPSTDSSLLSNKMETSSIESNIPQEENTLSKWKGKGVDRQGLNKHLKDETDEIEMNYIKIITQQLESKFEKKYNINIEERPNYKNAK